MTSTTSPVTVHLNDAKRSETFTAIATIAGSKAHRVTAATLLEDALAEVFVRMGYIRDESGRSTGVWGEITETRTIPAGETLYLYTQCGTARHAGGWRVFRNDYRPADAVTCAKCLKRETP